MSWFSSSDDKFNPTHLQKKLTIIFSKDSLVTPMDWKLQIKPLHKNKKSWIQLTSESFFLMLISISCFAEKGIKNTWCPLKAHTYLNEPAAVWSLFQEPLLKYHTIIPVDRQRCCKLFKTFLRRLLSVETAHYVYWDKPPKRREQDANLCRTWMQSFSIEFV